MPNNNFKMKVTLALAFLLIASPAFARSGDGTGGLVLASIIGILVLYFVVRNFINGEVEKGIQKRKAEIEAEATRQKEMTARAAEEERQKTLRYAEDLARKIGERKSDVVALEKAFQASYVHGRKWLAEFIATAFAAPEEAIAQGLENKKHPAQKAADEVRRVSAEKKALRVQLKYLEYAIKTYHEYYPVLEEYSDDILNELATLDLENDDAPDADRVARYISREEYARLSTTQRNQLALDKWKARRKSNVEIGRIYERYLGYLYEQDGWAVTFVGALEGLEDMGRDLLCIRDDEVHVVQAKYWSKHKTIHEKHIFQLYGTSLLVPRTHQELRGRRIVPIFATTTVLSDTALWAAKALDVQIRSIDMDQDYPVIKCNINGDERIYHLPFDQQYDRVRIIPAKGELYVKLVAEAEAKGFRRAKRFYGA
jgi:hypothetical protein